MSHSIETSPTLCESQTQTIKIKRPEREREKKQNAESSNRI